MAYNFNYDPREEFATYSRTPLGIVNLFLGVLRERFSPRISGQTTGFAWIPMDEEDPNFNVNAEPNYKLTNIYIEKAAAIETKVSNYCPAITVKRAAHQFTSPTIEDKVTSFPKTGVVYDYGQMHGGVTLACYSRTEAECEILSNLVYETFVRIRWILQKEFEILVCLPRVLTEVNVFEEGQAGDNRVYKADVLLELIFDFNYSSQPMAPKIKEIYQALVAAASASEGVINDFLQK